jgi:F-type H+-transporting ATPase subunit gamma
MSYEPMGEDMLTSVAPFYLASRLYGALLEASLCEQSARILSMDNATRTAGDMMQDLSLRYNKARQGVITQEITEIVSGADAISSEGSG